MNKQTGFFVSFYTLMTTKWSISGYKQSKHPGMSTQPQCGNLTNMTVWNIARHKYLHYSLYGFCKHSKKEMNLISTGNWRYMHLLPFHMPTYHFFHYSYIYSKTSLLRFWKKKIQYLGLVRTTFIKWKSLKLWHYCAFPRGNWYSLYHIIPQKKWTILHYIAKQVLESKFHHIPVLNNPQMSVYLW